MSVANPNAASVPPPSDYDVEFRSLADDAWYSVCTVLDGEKLTLKYQNFSDDEDSIFEVKNLTTLDELEKLKDRFRPISPQLQDNECHKVVGGVVVCVSHSFDGSDNRFYDATVDDVVCKEHSFDQGGEMCLCTYIVIMQHGPFAGCLVNKTIESLCLVQSYACLDPNLQLFLKMVKERLQNEPCVRENKKSATSFAKRLKQSTKCAERSPCKKQPPDEEKSNDHSDWPRDDDDLGGYSSVLLIDNLDKNLSPSTIVEFIHTHTSLSVQACVFPSMSSEMYTQGAIVLNCRKNLEKLSKFLDCQNHIITSKRGRPWVVTENLSGHDSFALSIQNLMHKISGKFCTSFLFCIRLNCWGYM
ncbi:SAWADEE PROTEIN [Salix purpurea]|uniref:SAWADEE PROTEIN n=1 Tax=Salix purpurea TaxID=77065 RepID=A0A9Q0SRJ4_SALPP|nr:SAWADEE PROTEIN [Salix purpurea]